MSAGLEGGSETLPYFLGEVLDEDFGVAAVVFVKLQTGLGQRVLGGFLKTATHKRIPISNNVLIEELLGTHGIICIEDLIDALWNCKKNQTAYEAVKQLLWPIQLSQLKEGIEEGNL